MSFNRENVTWESADGTWKMGFFTSFMIGEDEEWDVDYDFDSFEAVFSGPTQSAAWDAMNRVLPNPGGTNIVSDPKQAAIYDRMAKSYAEGR